MSTVPEPVVVIGIGNRWRRDDAVGLEVAARLRARGLDVRDAEGETVELLDLWERARSAIVVDAAGPGAQPGTVHRFEAADAPVPAGLSSTSTHALGIAEAVELGRALGRLPERLLVIAIEGADFSAGEGLTPTVAATVDPVVDMILQELQRA
jgi:hydrogenase maturation protease